MVVPASSWKESEENLLSCTAQIMNQAVGILRSRSITDTSYTFESKVIAGSTPGKHFRHVLDHLRILTDAIADWQARIKTDAKAVMRVDYDSRIASKLPHIETSVTASLREFERTADRLYRVFDDSHGRLYSQPLRLCATTPFVVEMDSTVGRELWFCGLHAIHHYALARVILVKELELEGVDDQFGVAPSTLVHREWRKESNRADTAHNVLSQGRNDELPTSGHAAASSSQQSSPSSGSSRVQSAALPSRPTHSRRQHQFKSKL
ncbi:hypothetical protein EX895_003647 [Sporisorium graminicola]|uniref:DinB-like domain-containing protein n=1 Tax=Sporisorium graminicola TaxID=280036 RepID=A0A4U7KRB5_9BASI|nr:hypothetical protein EX895_003647 [Sporisorium graminicola]TKY86970.1 hypothetical protein EX895_003647 [Sporisorium graminicola]